MIENPDLLNFLRVEYGRAQDGTLTEKRALALDYYNGLPFGDEVEGRSQVVTRDVAEVIDYMVVSVLRTMLSGDRIAEFEAKSAGEAQAVDDATDLIQWQFLRNEDGYRTIHNFLKDGLLEKSGVIKTWVEKRTRRQVAEVPSEHLDLSENGSPTYQGMPVTHAEMAQEGAPAVLDGSTGEMLDPGQPEVMRIAYDQPLPALFHDEGVPNEEFSASPDARDLEAAPYLCHATVKSLAELKDMGFEFEPEEIWSDNPESQILSDARDSTRSRQDSQSIDRRGWLRRVWLYEEYAFWDLTGTGVTERVCVHRVGSRILSAATVDEQPFVLWSPFPLAHRLIGDSLADKIMDIQRVRSVLRRQALDNLYLSNVPRAVIVESLCNESTVEDFLTVRPGSPIRVKNAGAIEQFAVPFTAAASFEADERLIGDRESRTGITRLNQGLDADALNKTAAGTAMMQATGQQMEDYVARNFAEAIGRLFLKKYRQLRTHGQPVEIQVQGQFRTIDPRAWPDDVDLRVRVGLGSGRKDYRIQMRQMILQVQQTAIEAGTPLASLKNVYNNLAGLVRDTQLGNVGDLFTDPDTVPPQPPQPNLEIAKLQAQQQMDQQKFAAEQQAASDRLAIQQNESQAKIDLGVQRHVADVDLERTKAAAELQLGRERLVGEAQLNMEQIASRERIALAQAAMDHERKMRQMDATSDTHLSADRPGGSLAE